MARSVLALGLVLILQSWTNHWLRIRDATWVPLPTQVAELASAEKVRTFSFGHWPSIVDWLWVKTLQDPSLQPVASGEKAAIAPLLDLATELDPAFFAAYYYGSLLLSIVRSDGESAVRLLLRGEDFRTKELPDYPLEFQESEWRHRTQIPLLLGYVYLYDLENLPKAAEYYRAASQQPDAPIYLKNLGERLKTPEGQYESAITYLTGMAKAEADPEMRDKLLKKRDALYVGLYLYEINQSFRSFLNRFPSYRAQVASKLSRMELDRYWLKFQKQFKVSKKDPFGGILSLDPSGRVISSSRKERAFGLE